MSLENPSNQGRSTAWTAPGFDLAPAPDPVDAAHAYVQELDRLVARAHDGNYVDVLRQLGAVRPPAGDAVAHLLERKRRELLERFDQLHQEHVHIPGLPLDDWLSFFFRGAEMAGAATVTVAWLDPAPGQPFTEDVAPSDAASYRARVAERGMTLAAVRGISYLSVSGHCEAALDAGSEWLLVSGTPFLYRETVRALGAKAPLSFALSYDLTRDLQEGSGLAVRVVLTNHSSDVIVLERLATDHAYDTPEGFSQPSLGRLVHDAEQDHFTYDSVARGVTTATFFTGVMRPGEQRSTVITLKMLGGGDCWREFSLRFLRFDEAAFKRVAYVAQPSPARSFPPQVVYASLASLPTDARVDTSSVILAPRADLDAARAEARWAYPFHVGRRVFSLAQAQRRMPEAGEAVHFSRWQQAWVLRIADGCALVSPSRVTRYPQLDPAVFIVIDESEQRVPIRFSEASFGAFRSLPLGITDWESHALGLSVSLPKLKLTSFFQELERLGCSLTLGENLLGRRTLWVSR